MEKFRKPGLYGFQAIERNDDWRDAYAKKALERTITCDIYLQKIRW
jgi:hypothetical protein